MRRKSLSDKIREAGPILENEAPADPPPEADHPGPAASTLPDATELHDRALTLVAQAMDSVRAGNPFSAESAMALADEILKAMEAGDDLFSLALHRENGEDFLARHGANVAVFAARLTQGLEVSRDSRVKLCAAGLLHDLGRAKLPGDLVNKPGPFTEKERREMQKSPEISRDLLAQYAPEHPFLAECAVQTYERADGSGYPKGLKSEDISDFAGILGLADFFEALIHSRPHRSRFLHHLAAREVLRTGKRQFEPWLMKAFLRNFSMFPLHSCVILNSGAMGKVAATRPDQPLRPVVRILKNSEGENQVEDHLVDLAREPLLFVTQAVSCQENP